MKLRAVLMVTVLALTACAPSDQDTEVVSDTTGMGGMAGMPSNSDMMGNMEQPAVMSNMQHDSMMQAIKNMPGDMQFMAMMTNHHTGLIAMAQQAMSKATDDSVKAIAHNLQAKQQQDNRDMSQMMQRMGGMHHTPMMMMENKAQLDTLTSKSGKEYDKYFLQTVIKHHEQGIGMVNEFMGGMKDSATRQMAERMKSEQQKEIRELQAKVKTL